MNYIDVFNGSTIYPAEISYSETTLTANIELSWPEEASTNVNLAAKIMDVTPSADGFSITLPNATKSGTGNTILFNNRGSYTFTVKDADGVQVVTIAAGTLWQVYLTDNLTPAGGWNILQYGATTSTANASALAGTGIVAVGTMLSQSVPVTTFSSDYVAGVSDRAQLFNWTGGAGTLTLPDPAAVGNNWFLYLRNSGTGAVTADAPGTSLIDGNSTLSFNPGESAIIACDGSNLYTIGFGQPAVFAFSYTVVDVSGSGTYTLSGSELNKVSYRFNGTLTGDREIIVPAYAQQYWVDNATTGSYVLTVKTAAGTGVGIVAGERVILYCDGTDVVNANTAGISLPILISQGGTGATTASAARINLGGTSTGIALFTAVNQRAAWTALGSVDGGAF